jgi:hypothetical protein
MKVMPFEVIYDKCPACGRQLGDYDLKYCESECAAGVASYVDATSHSSNFAGHLHVTCPTCGYKRLVQTMKGSDECRSQRTGTHAKAVEP